MEFARCILPGRLGEPTRQMLKGRDVLPVELETELNASGGISRGDCSESGVSQVRVRLEEIRMVQRIEHLEGELQPPVLLVAGWMERGKPDFAVRIPLNCQPPNAALTALFHPPPTSLLVPNGNS